MLHITVERFFVSQYRCFFESRIITLPINYTYPQGALSGQECVLYPAGTLETGSDAHNHRDALWF